MNEILDMKIGTATQTGKVVEIGIEDVPDKDGNVMPKIILSIASDNGANFRIDEAWVVDRYGYTKPCGHWLKYDSKGNILVVSTVAKVLIYFGAETLRDLIGKEVMLYPKPNGYLAIIATDTM